MCKSHRIPLAQHADPVFAIIFNSVNDGILVINALTKKFLKANSAMCAMLGYSVAELESMGIEDIHFQEDLPEIFNKFRDLSLGKKITAHDIRIKKKGGCAFYADITSSLMQFQGKKYLIGIFKDISEKKKQELELTQYRIHLKKLVHVKTAELNKKNEALKKTNIALEVLLKKRIDDKKRIEHNLIRNLLHVCEPYLLKLSKPELPDKDRLYYLEIVKTHLSSLKTKPKNQHYSLLSPMEIKIADCIRAGKQNKEVASFFNISVRTVESHCKNIRKKMGLQNSNHTLKTHLHTL